MRIKSIAMYLSHYQLNHKPFENNTNPRFFWFNETFAEAHAALEDGLQRKNGMILLTGDSGAGKTALIHSFIETIGPEISKAVIPDPDMDSIDFFNYLAAELDLNQTFADKSDFLTCFRRHLKEPGPDNDKQILIVIDEAQRASKRLLKDIRLLDDIGTGADVQAEVIIILSGQSRIIETLSDPVNTSLKSRLSANIKIDELNQADTEKYIAHRLKRAGAQNSIFTASARAMVYQITRGNPLQINNLCDRSLLTGYTEEALVIDSGIVTECAAELGVALDANAILADGAIQDIASDRTQATTTATKRGDLEQLSLLVLALIGAALIILLQFSITPQNESRRSTLRDHANQTFELYQRQLDETDGDVSE